MHSQIIVEVFPSSRYCLPEHTLRNSGFNRFTAALLKGRLKFCFLHNDFYEIQWRRIRTFSDPTRLHGQVHGNIWKFMANRHRSRGNSCWTRIPSMSRKWWTGILSTQVASGHAPRRTDSFSQNKPRKISLKNKRLLDDYLFTSTCFWQHWFPFKLENKLRFLNFPVGAGGVLVQKSPQVKTMLIFHRHGDPHHGCTGITWKNNTLLAYFFASSCLSQSLK